ncbi:MAG: enoyl-CoA hydratase/isomerase family protein, partial [Archangium sp.]
MSEVVRFGQLGRFGVATLNSPSSLNALSLEMVRLLSKQLRAWAEDPQICGVLLEGEGDKAFCAGGDIRELYQSLLVSKPSDYARSFFAEEYALDYAIHTFPKPFLCWGNGIVMGGGLGLMAGASHRVVTSSTRIAMPEINIGLFPDVGGSWFLRRMPGRVGLFLALTGAPLNASDARFCGLADFHVEHSKRGEVMEELGDFAWSGNAKADRESLSRLLLRVASEGPASNVRAHFDQIDALMAGDSLLDIARRLRSLVPDGKWMTSARENFVKGSPTSAAISFELWQRVLRLSLAEVFRLEYVVALGCAAHHDFVEGVRAL